MVAADQEPAARRPECDPHPSSIWGHLPDSSSQRALESGIKLSGDGRFSRAGSSEAIPTLARGLCHHAEMPQTIRDPDVTTIYASEAQWSSGALAQGRVVRAGSGVESGVPDVVDQDDLDLIVNQAFRGYHFAESFAAIHLFVRDGARSVIEKYDTYENHFRSRRQHVHPEKMALYTGAVSEEHRAVHHEICSHYRVQLPDLLVLDPNGSYGFAEVKGPTDGSIDREDQVGMRTCLGSRLGVRVEVISVLLIP